jgi:uncharacterized protein YegP (UPF0339 family)
MKDFAIKVCTTVGGWIGLDPRPAGFVLLGVGAILLVALIVIIALAIKSAKKKKARKVAEQENLSKPIETVLSPEIETKKEEPKEPEQVENTQKEETIVKKDEKKVESKKVAPKKSEPKKVATTKSPEKKETAKKEVKPTKKLNGKWVVEFKSAGEYMSKLLASNGEVMLSSEIYTTEEGAKNGIQTIIKGVDGGKFVIYQDKNKNFYYKLKTSGNRFLCAGEIYKSEDQCLKAVETVKRIAKDSTIVDKLVEGAKYIEYKPAKLDMQAIAKGLKGKWKIETVHNGQYSAKLYASNGQLMIATEEVSQKKSVVNGIEAVTKNAIAGNFIIDRDKFGRYYYKLRNAQKSVICIGEAYESLDSCVSAIESVRRFVVNAVTPQD